MTALVGGQPLRNAREIVCQDVFAHVAEETVLLLLKGRNVNDSFATDYA